MRPIFTLFAGAAILFCSCSSSRKAAQNSDDPGYSSGSPKSASGAGQSDYYSTAPSDNYVRMKTTDDARWSSFDDNNDYDNYYASAPMAASPYYAFGYSPYSFGYGYSPFGFGYGMYGYPGMSIGMGFWDPYFGWNSYFMWNCGFNPYFYNPYYGGSVIVTKSSGAVGTPSSSFYNRLSAFNASTYHTTGFVNGTNNRFYRPGGAPYSANTTYNSGTARRYGNTSFFNRTSNSRPANTGGSFGGQSRSFSAPSGSSGGGFGGGMSRGGGGGFRH